MERETTARLPRAPGAADPLPSSADDPLPITQEVVLPRAGRATSSWRDPLLAILAVGVVLFLGLCSFLTAGEDECRAWTIKKGTPSAEAGGTIHSDIQRGFIRAEVVSYEELVAAGSWDKAKAASKIRVEGKDYVFKEGDCTNFRFNV